MEVKLELQFEAISEIHAKKIVQAVSIDVKSSSEYFERSELELTSNGNKIFLTIIAKDFIAAKSSINATLLWLENSINIIEKFSNPMK